MQTDLRLDHIECADVMDYLRTLPDQCVNLVVTSPPYFGLRSYLPEGHDDKAREIGAEQTPAAYIARMVAVFAEVRRVLRDDGNVYVNLGDSFGSGEVGRNDAVQERTLDGRPIGKQRETNERQQARRSSGLPPKSLMLIPHRFAIAMQDDGWLLREDIVWQKPNPMPESVRDRCTRSHEYIFHFTKQPRYWYDAQAVAEDSSEVGRVITLGEKSFSRGQAAGAGVTPSGNGLADSYTVKPTRNRRSVWTINPANFKAAHFATFPEDIPEICIKAACPEWCCEKCGAPYEAQVERVISDSPASYKGSTFTNGKTGAVHDNRGQGPRYESALTGYAPTCTCNAGKRGGVVLDPFMGAGTVAMVAKRLHRFYIGCDLNAEYVRMARARVYGPLFSYEGAGS